MKWFYEKSFKGNYSQGHKVKTYLHSEVSAFQKIEVIDTYSVGKLLLLDGKTMVSDLDEFVYHEVISHVPAMVHPNAKRVLIIGGGDGGVVREFCKYPGIESIHLVEIDERVIEVSKKYFPQCTSGLSDPRVEIFPTDGIQYIKDHKNYYDIIVVDSTDPVDFASGLFTSEFYQSIKESLTEDGIMTNQTENYFYDEYDIKKIYQNMRKHFPIVSSYSAPMMIYPGVNWTFGFCSKKYGPTQIDLQKFSFMDQLERNLKWYNKNWHKGIFQLSNFHKKMIGEIS